MLLLTPAGVDGGCEELRPSPMLDRIPPALDKPGRPPVIPGIPLLLLVLAPNMPLLLALGNPRPWPTAATVDASDPVLL
jgi:hypothetical protein